MLFTWDLNVSAAELRANEGDSRVLELILNMMQLDCNASCSSERPTGIKTTQRDLLTVGDLPQPTRQLNI